MGKGQISFNSAKKNNLKNMSSLEIEGGYLTFSLDKRKALYKNESKEGIILNELNPN